MGRPTRQWWPILILLLGLLLTPLASAQSLSLSYLSRDAYPPAQEIVSGRLDSQFTPSPGLVLNRRTAEQKVLWWRITANRDYPAEELPQLVVTSGYRKELEAWLPGISVPVRRSLYGPDADMSHSTRFLVMPLPRGLKKGQAIYLRMQALTSIQSTVTVLPLSEVHRRDLQYVAVNSFVISAMTVVALLAFGLWGGMNERGYAYLGLTLVAQILYLGVMGGEIRAVPLLAWLGSDSRANIVLSTAATIASLRFFVFFLDVRRTQPWASRVLEVCNVVFWAVLLATFYKVFPLTAYIGNTTLLVALATVLTVSAVAMFRRQREAFFLMLSWLPMVLLLVVQVAVLHDWLPETEWMEHVFPIGFAFGGLGLMIGLADKLQQLRRDRDAANRLATYDSLTGAMTRAAIDKRLRSAIERAHHSSRPLSVVFFDIDHFKRINDEHGHRIGDQALRIVALRVRNRLRDYDLSGRYGGDEMLVVLPDTALPDALRVAEHLRISVSNNPLSIDGRLISATLSLGVAELSFGEGPEQLFERVDTALYASKAAGRNRVTTAPPLPLAAPGLAAPERQP